MAQQSQPSSSSSRSVTSPKTPFDWLQGNLFFGGVRNSRNGNDGSTNDGGGDDNGVGSSTNEDCTLINSSTDVAALLNGVSENLQALISQTQLLQQSEAIAAIPPQSTDVQSSIETIANHDASIISSISDKIAVRLSRLRFLLFDERRATSQQPQHLIESQKVTPSIVEATVAVVTGNQRQHIVPALLENMGILPFESRKHVAAIFNYLLICGLEGIDALLYNTAMKQFVSYVEANYEQTMTYIVQGHDLSRRGITPDIALHFGSMYRSCTRHPVLYQQLVGTRDRAERFVYPFLDEYVHMANFEISSDAMESLRAAFAANTDRVGSNIDDKSAEQWNRSCIADIAAEFLNRDYEALWDDRFTPKLLSNTANYMSRRVALQILSTVLLKRSNYSVMIRYVASRANLIVVMHLLRDTSPHITLDAFHVFKVFVANPNKPPEIVKILHDNKSKLCAYLTTLHQEKEENDTQFRDEKALIISTIDAQ
jgi:calcium binding protein 39